MFKRLVPYLFLTLMIASCVNIFPEPHSLKYDDRAFNDIARFILDQDDVFEMDDFTRHYKSINGVSIKLTTNEGNQHAQLLNIVLDSLQIDAKIVSALKTKLEESKLREFHKSSDTILFVVDGFLNDSWGFMYAKRGLVMDSTSFSFKGHSIHCLEHINSNWKRVAMH